MVLGDGAVQGHLPETIARERVFYHDEGRGQERSHRDAGINRSRWTTHPFFHVSRDAGMQVMGTNP